MFQAGSTRSGYDYTLSGASLLKQGVTDVTGHQRRKYPTNWEQLARACKERADWKCEHCHVEQFATRTSKRGTPYFIYLHAAHIYQLDTRNTQPELIALCISCHAAYDYQHKQREKRIELERLKHRRELAARVDYRFYGG